VHVYNQNSDYFGRTVHTEENEKNNRENVGNIAFTSSIQHHLSLACDIVRYRPSF
jgi:hypothetical protein